VIKSRRKLVIAIILIIIVFIYSTFQEKVEDYEYYIANSINIVATDYVENLKILGNYAIINNATSLKIMMDYGSIDSYPEFYSVIEVLVSSSRQIISLSIEDRAKVSELYLEIFNNIENKYHERKPLTRFRIERIFEKNQINVPTNTNELMDKIKTIIN